MQHSFFPVRLHRGSAIGIAATFISTTIGASVVALRSSVPFTIAGPDSSTSVVTATLVAAFVQWLVAHGATDHVLGATLFLLALSSALVGILLCWLRLAGAGPARRVVPYPVIGGFLGATGWCESGHYRYASCRCQH